MAVASIAWALIPASGFAQDEPRQKAFRELTIAEAAWQQTQQLRSHPDFAEANSRDSELSSSLERAQRLLQAAKRGLEQAEQRQSVTGFKDTAVLAKRVSRQLEAYETRLRELWEEIEVERRPPPPTPPPPAEPEAAEDPPSTVGAEEAELSTPEMFDDPSSGSEPLGAEAVEPGAVGPGAVGPAAVQVTEAASGEAASGEAVPQAVTSPPVLPTPSVSEPPATRPSPPRRTRRGPPPLKLRQIADAFFTGDYQATIELVAAADFLDPEPRAHGLLFRGAARYALFLLGGETDFALRGLATEDIAACRRDAPDLSPSADAFSPRFRDFFAATR